MSVVACKIYKNRIEIASDSIVTRCCTQEKVDQKKVHCKLFKIKKDFIIGGIGTAEETALLRLFCGTYSPKNADPDDIFLFMTEFAEWKKKKTDVKYDLDNNYIFVFKNKAFSVERFFIHEIDDFAAIGAGMDYALSALYLNFSVKKAVETACELSIFCEKPINFFSVPK